MTDMDELRETLAEPPDFTPRALDLDAIMTSGTRLRRRRRAAVTAAAIVAVAGVMVGGAQVTGRLGAGPPELPAQPPPSAVVTTPPADAITVIGAVGSAVDTGLAATPGSRWILHMAPTIGVAAGEKTELVLSELRKDGSAEEALRGGDTTADPLKPGFHDVQHAYPLENNVEQPAFGYFVGEATKITGTGGKSLATAKTATWSENSKVIIFWFDIRSGKDVTRVNALDATGKQIATLKLPFEGGN